MAGRNGKRPRPAKKGTALVKPALIPRPDGHGALLSGGMPGNKGGTGRPPSAIRATAREAFDQALPIIAKIVSSAKTKDIDRIRGADVLGRYGMGHPVSIDDVVACWNETVSVIRERFAPDISEPFIAQLRPIWVGIGRVKQKG